MTNQKQTPATENWAWIQNNIDYVLLTDTTKNIVIDLFETMMARLNVPHNIMGDTHQELRQSWHTSSDDLTITINHKAKPIVNENKKAQLINLWSAEIKTKDIVIPISTANSKHGILNTLTDVISAIEKEMIPFKDKYSNDVAIVAKALRQEILDKKMHQNNQVSHKTNKKLLKICRVFKEQSDKIAHRPINVEIQDYHMAGEQKISFEINGNHTDVYLSDQPNENGTIVWHFINDYADDESDQTMVFLKNDNDINEIREAVDNVLSTVSYNRDIFTTEDVSYYIVKQFGDHSNQELKAKIVNMCERMKYNLITTPNDIVENPLSSSVQYFFDNVYTK